MPSDFAPTTDGDVKTTVRHLTGYDGTELSDAEFSTLLDLTKLTLVNETSVTSDEGDNDVWYTDNGLGQALIFTTAIRAKATVENYSVDRWDFADQQIDVRGAGDPDQVQFQRWMKGAANGLDASSEYEDDDPTPSNTASYIT